MPKTGVIRSTEIYKYLYIVQKQNGCMITHCAKTEWLHDVLLFVTSGGRSHGLSMFCLHSMVSAEMSL